MAYVVGDYITAAGLNSWNWNNREARSVGHNAGFWRVHGICHTLKKDIGYANGSHSNNWFGWTYAYSCHTFNPGLSNQSLLEYFIAHGTKLYTHNNWPFGPSWSTTVYVSSPSSTEKFLFGMCGLNDFGSGKYELIKGQIDCVQGSKFEELSYSWDGNYRPIKPASGAQLSVSKLNNYTIGTYDHG